MQTAADLPIIAAIAVAFFLIVGAGLTLIGAFGFLRLPTFYERLHAPALGASWGIGGIMTASMIYFTLATERLVIHEILIGIFVTVTTPVTFMLVSRAALHRDRTARSGTVPSKPESPARYRELPDAPKDAEVPQDKGSAEEA